MSFAYAVDVNVACQINTQVPVLHFFLLLIVGFVTFVTSTRDLKNHLWYFSVTFVNLVNVQSLTLSVLELPRVLQFTSLGPCFSVDGALD